MLSSSAQCRSSTTITTGPRRACAVSSARTLPMIDRWRCEAPIRIQSGSSTPRSSSHDKAGIAGSRPGSSGSTIARSRCATVRNHPFPASPSQRAAAGGSAGTRLFHEARYRRTAPSIRHRRAFPRSDASAGTCRYPLPRQRRRSGPCPRPALRRASSRVASSADRPMKASKPRASVTSQRVRAGVVPAIPAVPPARRRSSDRRLALSP